MPRLSDLSAIADPRFRPLLGFFNARFPGDPDRTAYAFSVPGRIEVLGKHTDYAGGHSLLAALDRGFLAVAAPNDRGTVRMAEDRSEFQAVEFPLRPDISPRVGDWANYPMTMAARLAANFGAGAPLAGVDIAFCSDLPVGSGMSGSSALMMMSFLAVASANGICRMERFRRDIHDGVDLAMYLACAENGQTFRSLEGGKGVGTFGGSEDHTEILNGKAGILSLYEFAPTVHKADFAFPAEWRLAVAFSGVRAEKTREALEKYNLVSRRARLAVEAHNAARGTDCRLLRGLADLHGGVPCAAWRRGIGEGLAATDPALALSDRALQFAREDRRHIPKAVLALIRRDLPAFGAVLTASHRDSKRHLWNIVPQVDFLSKAAARLGAAGASGFGAGFGGSVYAVVGRNAADAFLTLWRDAYAARYPAEAAEADFFLSDPSDGIRDWSAGVPRRWVETVPWGG